VFQFIETSQVNVNYIIMIQDQSCFSLRHLSIWFRAKMSCTSQWMFVAIHLTTRHCIISFVTYSSSFLLIKCFRFTAMGNRALFHKNVSVSFPAKLWIFDKGPSFSTFAYW